MEINFRSGCGSEVFRGDAEEMVVDGVRKGPWTDEEDALLFNYVTLHGEGRWNSIAHNTGLKRTGKSCRLRWLNYLRPDLRRGNISLEEQLLILELHSRWGNRWSKIAKQIPGRTDNEIKNYWRTRVQKQAKHLKCDVNSQQFRDTLRYVFIPRLTEKIRASKAGAANYTETDGLVRNRATGNMQLGATEPKAGPETSLGGASSDSWDTQVSPMSGLTESYSVSGYEYCGESTYSILGESGAAPELMAPGGYSGSVPGQPAPGVHINTNSWFDGGDTLFDVGLWNEESLRFLRQQLYEEDL